MSIIKDIDRKRL